MADTWESALKRLNKHVTAMAEKLQRYEKQHKEDQQALQALEDSFDAVTLERDALADFVSPIIIQMAGVANGLPGDQVTVAEVTDEKIEEIRRLTE